MAQDSTRKRGASAEENAAGHQSRGVRTISRLTVVLPPQSDAESLRLVELLASQLSVYGTQVARHVCGVAPEGTMRADVALWLPDDDGVVKAVRPHEASARVHVALVASEDQDPAGLHGYDAVLVPHQALHDPIRRIVERTEGELPEVFCARLPLQGADDREQEKIARKVEGQTVVMVDVRASFERDVERVLIQISLCNEPMCAVLRVPHEGRARARLRHLCERHDFSGWMASGPEALSSSASAIDMLVGRPKWTEMMLAASAGVDVHWIESDDGAPDLLSRALQQAQALGTVGGVLQLAATLERRLRQPGARKTSATLLTEELLGDARTFLRALGEVRKRIDTPTGAAAWERVGPEGRSETEPAVVEARARDGSSSRAERIEEELEALKAKMEGLDQNQDQDQNPEQEQDQDPGAS